jgi:hypothetical protein
VGNISEARAKKKERNLQNFKSDNLDYLEGNVRSLCSQLAKAGKPKCEKKWYLKAVERNFPSLAAFTIPLRISRNNYTFDELTALVNEEYSDQPKIIAAPTQAYHTQVEEQKTQNKCRTCTRHHPGRVCWNTLTCTECKQLGCNPRRCHNRNRKPKRKRQRADCDNCGLFGYHTAENCTRQKKKTQPTAQLDPKMINALTQFLAQWNQTSQTAENFAAMSMEEDDSNKNEFDYPSHHPLVFILDGAAQAHCVNNRKHYSNTRKCNMQLPGVNNKHNTIGTRGTINMSTVDEQGQQHRETL